MHVMQLIFFLFAGVGVRFKNLFLSTVANNTAVVSTGDNDYILLCQSALQNCCNAGNWNIPGDSSVATHTEVCDSLEIFSTAQLSLSPSLISGLYTCSIPDETLLARKVFIGIYSNLEERGMYVVCFMPPCMCLLRYIQL